MQPYRFRTLSAIMLLSIVGQISFADQQNNDSDNNVKSVKAASDDKHSSATEYTLPTIVINYANHLNNDENKTRNNSNTSSAPISVSLMPNYANQSIDRTIEQNAWVNSNNSSAANPSFYLKGQRASVLLNGIPLNQFNSQAQNISLIPQDSIESIAIDPTASSVLYGGMGLGGTINIEQKFIAQDKYMIGLSGGYPFGAGVNVFINQLLDNEKTWSLQLANNSQSIDGYRDYSRNNSNNAYIALMHQTNTQKLSLNFSDSYQYLHFPGALNQQQSDDNPWQATSNGKEKYINHTVNTQLNFEQTLDKQWQFNLKSQYQQQWANAIFADSNYSSKQGSSLFYLRPSIVFDNDFVKNTFGTEFNYQTFRQSATTNNATQTNIALFNQSDFTLAKNWQSGIGGRFEHSYTTGDFISRNSSGSQVINIGAGDIYLQYNWSKAFNTRASVSYAYQLPFIDQSNLTPGTTTSFGLNPQTAWIYQLDNTYKNDRLTLKNSSYWMLINNQIDYNPNFTSPYTPFGANINLPPTQTIGNLFALDYAWLPSLSLGGSFAFNLNTFRSGTFKTLDENKNPIDVPISNNQVPGQPPFTAEIHSHWQFNDKLSFWLQEQYYSASYAYGDYTNTLAKQSGYFLTNLGAKYQLDHWQFNFNIYNLFNKFYYSYVSTYNLKDLSYYPADSIVAMLNIQYQF
ncbi:TonB-dependent receptor [Cysteiniphilum sp. JM-1]|uniref:TonB-dependent receptor n=1 Tax=Cysteiniphilum sp. JM-1 TaxID=2610891 RepID=UPI001245ECB7|nr:TonB-dependent receptor [Cysteiniphilum sp. JM-1]